MHQQQIIEILRIVFSTVIVIAFIFGIMCAIDNLFIEPRRRKRRQKERMEFYRDKYSDAWIQFDMYGYPLKIVPKTISERTRRKDHPLTDFFKKT